MSVCVCVCEQLLKTQKRSISKSCPCGRGNISEPFRTTKMLLLLLLLLLELSAVCPAVCDVLIKIVEFKSNSSWLNSSQNHGRKNDTGRNSQYQ